MRFFFFSYQSVDMTSSGIAVRTCLKYFVSLAFVSCKLPNVNHDYEYDGVSTVCDIVKRGLAFAKYKVFTLHIHARAHFSIFQLAFKIAAKSVGFNQTRSLLNHGRGCGRGETEQAAEVPRVKELNLPGDSSSPARSRYLL